MSCSSPVHRRFEVQNDLLLELTSVHDVRGSSGGNAYCVGPGSSCATSREVASFAAAASRSSFPLALRARPTKFHLGTPLTGEVKYGSDIDFSKLVLAGDASVMSMTLVAGNET